MKALALFGFGCVVFVLLGAAANRVQPSLTLTVAFTACAGSMAAWLGHTEWSRAAAEDFRSALADIGMSQKEAAYRMGIPAPVLNEQLSGGEMLSEWRRVQIGPEFEEAYALRRLARVGGYTLIRPLKVLVAGRVQA